MHSPAQAYEELISLSREHALVRSVADLLAWDQETMMPRGGEALRARQMALLAGLAHEHATNAKIPQLLETITSSSWLSSAPAAHQANVREIRRTTDRQRKIPRALVEEIARTIPASQSAWAEAKNKNDFAGFLPHLTKMIRLKREEAQALSSSGADLYDAFLDEYEPGAKIKDVAAALDALAEGLVPMVRKIIDKGNPPSLLAGRTFAVEKQKILCASLPAALGLPPTRSRLDVSAHPFCQRIGAGDVRITTRFAEDDFQGAFFGTLHETGHALYEDGLDADYDGTPAGTATSLGLHESQSRLWENLVGRSASFWRHYGPILRSFFQEPLHGIAPMQLFQEVNRVEASFIRTESDEVTYNLHIILRLRLERKILSGDLDAKDIPSAWNEEMKNALGIVPPSHALGCLQDVHWSCGLFGYFPTYALGNMYAAQLFDAARKDLGDVDAAFAAGDFAPLLHWLRKKIHLRGTQASGAQIVEDATGYPPNPTAFLRYIQKKYAGVYNVNL